MGQKLMLATQRGFGKLYMGLTYVVVGVCIKNWAACNFIPRISHFEYIMRQLCLRYMIEICRKQARAK